VRKLTQRQTQSGAADVSVEWAGRHGADQSCTRARRTEQAQDQLQHAATCDTACPSIQPLIPQLHLHHAGRTDKWSTPLFV